MLPDQLTPLSAYPQFIIHKSKFPFDPLTLRADLDAHNPVNWMDDATARTTAEMFGTEYGIGFVLTANDPFWCMDIDHCIVDGVMSPTAVKFTQMLSHCAIEVSQSGEGLHIWGSGVCPPHGTRNREYGLEFYSHSRFIALTGNMMGEGNAAIQCDMSWLTEYFPEPVQAEPVDWSDGPCDGSNPIPDDDQLITRAMQSGGAVQAFSGKAGFSDLWNANVPVLSQNYPDPMRDYDASSADLALSGMLAFWTDTDCTRIERLMRRSKLMREKWDRRETGLGYLRTTILKAVGLCSDVYGTAVPGSDSPASQASEGPPPPPTSLTGELKAGLEYYTPQNQQELFNECVYITDEHKILTPNGSHLSPERFKAVYGGRVYALDSTGGKTTNNAFDAFTLGQGYQGTKVDKVAFRPHMPKGHIFHEEGVKFVNSYIPIETERKAGDPAPFLDWLARVLPDERDRQILVCWIASLVQNPGVKPQWAPLLQGAEGNGKSMLANVIKFCVGHRYSHTPKASDLTGGGLKFNHWMADKLFICIDEIYTLDRHMIMEDMKTMITESKQELQAKGGAQYMGDTPFGVLFLSNHKDAIRVTPKNRRYAVFYCAQQSADDLVRDGMDGEYFPDLYDWLRADGFAIMNNYLREYAIEDSLNPSTQCQRAPQTSSSVEAVHASLGGVEQEITDAIESGRPGFAGGWVSSIMLSYLLTELRMNTRVPHNKRREIMSDLGYEWHPALPGGRVNNPIPQEVGKPKLFCRRGHISTNITTPSEVVHAYCKAQGYAPSIDVTVNSG